MFCCYRVREDMARVPMHSYGSREETLSVCAPTDDFNFGPVRPYLGNMSMHSITELTESHSDCDDGCGDANILIGDETPPSSS